MVLTLSLVLSCKGKDIVPDFRIYKQIPFVDCEEAIYVTTVTRQKGRLTCAEWAKLTPWVIAIDPEGWEKIKLSWLKACRFGKPEECNVALESVDTLIKNLDDITRSLVPKP